MKVFMLLHGTAIAVPSLSNRLSSLPGARDVGRVTLKLLDLSY